MPTSEGEAQVGGGVLPKGVGGQGLVSALGGEIGIGPDGFPIAFQLGPVGLAAIVSIWQSETGKDGKRRRTSQAAVPTSASLTLW